MLGRVRFIRARVIVCVLGAAITAAVIAAPASAQVSVDGSALAASSGNDSELYKSIPIGKRPGQRTRVAMTIPPQKLGGLLARDRLEINAEIEVSVCMKPNKLHPGDGRPCVGKRYGYDPRVRAQAVLASSATSTGAGQTLPVSERRTLRCTQSQPDRNHHCVLVIPPSLFQVPDVAALPCAGGACHLNLLLSASHRNAKRGHRLVLGSDEDDGGVNGDKGRLNALRLRPNLLGDYPRPDEFASSERQLAKLPIAAKGRQATKRVVATAPLRGLEVGDRLVFEAASEGRIGHLPYNVFLTSTILLSSRPDSADRDDGTFGTTDLHGQVTKANGFNCTQGSSAHPNPCKVRKVGVITVVKEPKSQLHANLAIGAMAIGTEPLYSRWRGRDAVRLRAAEIRVRRYRGP